MDVRTKRGETIKPVFEMSSDDEFNCFYLCLTSKMVIQIGHDVLHIYFTPTIPEDENYRYPANSAVLYDILIEKSRRYRGRGSELLEIVDKYGKSRGGNKILCSTPQE